MLKEQQQQLFVAFPWVVTSTGPRRVYDLCVYHMTGTPKGSTESGFMEKPGIETATPGLKVDHQLRWTMSINFDL